MILNKQNKKKFGYCAVFLLAFVAGLTAQAEKVSVEKIQADGVAKSVTGNSRNVQAVPAGDAAKTLKVFILAGQSNMQGYGLAEASEKHPFDKPKGGLRWLIDNPKTGPDFAHLMDAGENYVERDDVKIYYERTNTDIASGNLAIGYGGHNPTEALVIGPEFGFGWGVGKSLDGPVLLLKTAWGAQSLSGDFRPPSSGGKCGHRYTQMVKIVHKVLDDIGSYFPEYKGFDYELAGFAWHQGFSDLADDRVIHYEENLTNLINDLRKEFKVPDLPFVIGESGFHGWDNPKWDNGRMLRQAQANVCDSALHPEFAGKCGFVSSMPAHKQEYSGFNDASIHWFNSFFSYYTLGSDMGHEMVELLQGHLGVSH